MARISNYEYVINPFVPARFKNGVNSRSSAHILQQDSVSTTPAKVLKGSPSATGARVPAEHLKEKEVANGEFPSVHPPMCTDMLSQ